MDQGEARLILVKLRRELTETQAAVAAGQKRAGALEKLIDGYIELFPDLADERTDRSPLATLPEPDRPKGQDAIVKVMESVEWRGRYWTIPAMTDELANRGWLPESDDPSSAVRTSMARAASSHPRRIYKGKGSHGTLVYYYQHDDMPPPRFHDRSELLSEIDGALGESPASPLSPAESDRPEIRTQMEVYTS